MQNNPAEIIDKPNVVDYDELPELRYMIDECWPSQEFSQSENIMEVFVESDHTNFCGPHSSSHSSGLQNSINEGSTFGAQLPSQVQPYYNTQPGAQVIIVTIPQENVVNMRSMTPYQPVPSATNVSDPSSSSDCPTCSSRGFSNPVMNVTGRSSIRKPFNSVPIQGSAPRPKATHHNNIQREDNLLCLDNLNLLGRQDHLKYNLNQIPGGISIEDFQQVDSCVHMKFPDFLQNCNTEPSLGFCAAFIMKRSIQEDPLHERNERGYSAVTVCTEKNWMKMLLFLLSFNPLQVDYAALFMSVVSTNADILEILVKKLVEMAILVDWNIQWCGNKTLLQTAVSMFQDHPSSIKVVRLLLNAGCSVYSRTQGYDSLAQAAFSSHASVLLAILLEHIEKRGTPQERRNLGLVKYVRGNNAEESLDDIIKNNVYLHDNEKMEFHLKIRRIINLTRHYRRL